MNELLIVQMRKGRSATIQGLHFFKSFYPVIRLIMIMFLRYLFNDKIINK